MFASNGSSVPNRNSNRQSLYDSEDLGPAMPGSVYIRIHIPDNNSQKCLQFLLSDPVFRMKQQIISMMGQDLSDPLNYGLFWPPNNGKSGKFLQEERLLQDYPLQGPIGLLELKYKRRNYDGVSISNSKLKKIHTKNNLKQFVDVVRNGDVPKVYKWITKGIDPNFHCKDSGETPLTIASNRQKPRELMMALTNGGAHIDFRSRDSMTPLHKAAICGNLDAIRTLLDLGQNPNTFDTSGLSPLFYTVRYDTSPQCTEALLYDHSNLGVADENGLQEIHEACRYGRIQHLEHLITYGADLNAVTKNGNSPLHICALTGKENCARILLFRGARRDIENVSGETAHQLAIMNRRMDIAEVIASFKDEDVVRLKGSPRLNRNRRASVSTLQLNNRCSSLSQLSPQDPGQTPPNGDATANGSVSQATHIYASTSNQPVMRVNRQADSVSLSDKSSGGSKSINKNGASRSVTDLNLYDSISSANTGLNFRSSQYSNYARAPLMPMLSVDMVNFPRSIVLQKGSSGFGFVLRGSKNSNVTDFIPTAEVPALQYFESIQPGSPADKAGLKKGDFVLEINNIQCLNYSHDQVVSLIREAGDTLAMKVMTVDTEKLHQQNQVLDQLDQTLREFDDNTSLRSLYSNRGPVSSLPPGDDSAMPPHSSEPFRPMEQEAMPGPPSALVAMTENQIKAKLRANAQTSSNHQIHQDEEQLDLVQLEYQQNELRALPPQAVVLPTPHPPNAPPSTPSPAHSKSKKVAPPPPIRTISQSTQPMTPSKNPGIQHEPPIYTNDNPMPSLDELNHLNLPKPPASVISDTSSTGSANKGIEIPPPDYMDNSDEETKTVSGLQSMIQAEFQKRNQNQKLPSPRPQSVSAPPLPSPPITAPIQPNFAPTGAVPPPPPPPPPPPVPGTTNSNFIPPKKVSTEPVKSNGPPVRPKPGQLSHDDHLKNVLAMRKKKLEESPSIQEEIVDKVIASKRQSKVFEFKTTAVTNSEQKKPPPLSAPYASEQKTSNSDKRASSNGPITVASNTMFFPAQSSTDAQSKPAVNGSIPNFKAQAEQLRQEALKRQNQCEAPSSQSIQSQQL